MSTFCWRFTSKKKLVNLQRSVELLKIISKEQVELKQKSNKLSEDIQSREIKYIEILSIFAAIIVFAAGSFTTLLNVGRGISFADLRGILIGVGIILFLFVAFIIFLSKIPYEKIWNKITSQTVKHFLGSFIIVLPIVALVGAIMYYLNFHIKQDLKDTIQKQNHIIFKQDTVIRSQQNLIKSNLISHPIIIDKSKK